MPTPKLSCATQAIDAVDLEMLSTPTCRWRNPNYRLNTEIKAVLFQETTCGWRNVNYRVNTDS